MATRKQPIGNEGLAGIDPTENVTALVEAQAATQKELRLSDNKFYDAAIACVKEMSALQAKYVETLRLSDLDRLDKTRQVDVLAATASAASLATAVQTLANTSDRNAETLRNLVNATAATMAKQTSDQAQVLSAQTDSLVKGINAQIAELQKAQYQTVGKSSVIDPAMTELSAKVDRLALIIAEGARAQANTKGESVGQKNMVAWVVGGVLLLVAVVGGVTGIISVLLQMK